MRGVHYLNFYSIARLVLMLQGRWHFLPTEIVEGHQWECHALQMPV